MSSTFVSRALTASVIATLGLSGVASAKAGDKSFSQTYPHASALCARATTGTLPKRLQPQAAAVTAACNKLQSAFGPLQSTVQAAEASFAQGIATDKANVRAACATKGQACRTARIQARADERNLRAQRRLAARAYFVGVESNRRTFWASIRALRGGRAIQPDRPVPVQNS